MFGMKKIEVLHVGRDHAHAMTQTDHGMLRAVTKIIDTLPAAVRSHFAAQDS